MIGQKFGRLTVTEFFQRKNGRDKYVCLCDCGKEAIVEARNLKGGYTKSCGCLRSNNWKKHRGERHDG